MSDERVSKLIDEAVRMRYSRRGVLKRAAALGVSASAVSAALAASASASPAPRRFGKAPAFLQGTSLNILAGTYFVPAGQEHYTQRAQAWGAENNVDVTVDYINWPDIQARIGSAVSGGAGPDIVELRETWPYLYYQNMVDVHDLATRLGDERGGYYEWVTNTASVDGHWYSIPVGSSSAAFVYRMSYFQQAGIADPTAFPKTWDELFAVGKQLKAMGKPLGQGLGHSPGDPPNFCYSYMWSYGAMEVGEDGQVAFQTDQFIEGMNKFVQGWKDAFDETGLAWDDGTNNRAYLSDQISTTINGSSIYIAAQDPEDGNPAIAEDTNHAGFPAGPAGRFNTLGSWSYGIMNYSENQEAARAFLEWWTQPAEYQAWLDVQQGYIIPPVAQLATLPIYTEDPKLAPYLEVIEYGRNKGYAGPANQPAATASSQYIVVDTFANAIQNNDAEGAIRRGAQLLERIYSR